MSEDHPITWRGRDLSTDASIMYYYGRLHIDSIHGSAYLQDLPESPHLFEVLWSDDYEVEIRVIRRLSNEVDEAVPSSAFDQVRVECAILARERGAADDAEFAASAGCSVPQLLARSQRHEFFCVEFAGTRYWPRWQLGLPGLSNVLPVLADKGASGFSIVLFFTTPTDVLALDDIDELPDVHEDDSPLSLLRRSGASAVSRVVRHAHRFGEHGAT